MQVQSIPIAQFVQVVQPNTKSATSSTIQELCSSSRFAQANAAFAQNPDSVGAQALINHSLMFQPDNPVSFCYSVYTKLVDSGVQPTVYVFSAFMNVCRKVGDYDRLLALLDDMEKYSVMSKSCFGMLCAACAKVGNSVVAHRLLEKLQKNLFAFAANEMDCTQLIQAFIADNGRHISFAMQVFHLMQRLKLKPNQATYILLLKGCTGSSNLALGKELHSQIIKDEVPVNVALETTLLHMYAKCGDLDTAHKIFASMKHKDVVAYTTIISAYGKANLEKSAYLIFQQMKAEAVPPNVYTYATLLSCCTDLQLGKQLYAQAVETGFGAEIELQNTMMSFYSRFGMTEEASRIFSSLPYHTVTTWNTMISSYVRSGDPEMALSLFHQMKARSQPNSKTFATILSLCTHSRNWSLGQQIYDEAVGKGLNKDEFQVAAVAFYAESGNLTKANSIFESFTDCDVALWTTIISAFGRCGQKEKAMNLFNEMKTKGIYPNALTFATLIAMCTDLEDWALGKQLIATATTLFKDNLELQNTIISFHLKSGNLDAANALFVSMAVRDIVTWNTMISGCTNNGKPEHALLLFDQMNIVGVCANMRTYAFLIAACTDLFDWTRGSELYETALKNGGKYSIELHNSAITFYSKSGSFERAVAIFSQISKPNVTSWNAILAVYGRHGHGNQVLELFQRMQAEGVSPNALTFVSLLNALSHAGMAVECLRHFDLMTNNFNITPTVAHQNCVIDALGRAGRFADLEVFLQKLPSPDVVTWRTVLGACRKFSNLELAKFAAEQVFKTNPKDGPAFVILIQIASTLGFRDEAQAFREKMGDLGVVRIPGRATLQLGSKTLHFCVGDKSISHWKQLSEEAVRLASKMKQAGYSFNTSVIIQPFHTHEDNELHLCQHAEKLALIYGLLFSPPGAPLKITKNLRLCADCHSATKFISWLCKREVTVSDANCVHHMKDNKCSCQDYF